MITRIRLGQAYIDEIDRVVVIFPNKTNKYLLPCLKEYGEEFMEKLNSVFKIAAGIGDVVVENRGIRYGMHIFLQVETALGTPFFIKFLNWIRKQPMYEQDYIFDNIQTSTQHMVVLKFPDKYKEAFEQFKIGNFSLMFDEKTVNSIYAYYPHTRRILTKDNTYAVRFIKRLNARYGTTLRPEDGWTGEFDFKPEDDDEVFNNELKI